jgi:hypothetical protein
MGNSIRHRPVPLPSRSYVFVVQIVALLAAVSGALLFFAVREMTLLHEEVSDASRRVDQNFHSLRLRVGFDSERERLLRGIQGAILKTRPQIGPGKSLELATLVLESSEKYPGVDPLLLVSVGIVESGYDVEAISHAGARGLYQIYPPTGRVLAGMLGWDFDESLLHDPAKNTEMAACYLNLLGSAYNDTEMILAEYNGGPLNAGYFRAKVEKLAGETRSYVPRVIAVYERLSREMGRPTPGAAFPAAPDTRTVASAAIPAVTRKLGDE